MKLCLSRALKYLQFALIDLTLASICNCVYRTHACTHARTHAAVEDDISSLPPGWCKDSVTVSVHGSPPGEIHVALVGMSKNCFGNADVISGAKMQQLLFSRPSLKLRTTSDLEEC